MSEQTPLSSKEVEAALTRLPDAHSADEHFDILMTLVTFLHGPILPDDGYADEDLRDVRVPGILRRWYRWAGKRSNILSGQNWLLAPDRVHQKNGRAIFTVENQGCYEWAADPNEDDPPVYGTDDPYREKWQVEQHRVSEHLIMCCLFEAAIGSPFGAMGVAIPDATYTALSEIVTPVPLPPWRWLKTRAHFGSGLSLTSMEEDPGFYTITIGAESDTAFQPLTEIINNEWEFVGYRD